MQPQNRGAPSGVPCGRLQHYPRVSAAQSGKSFLPRRSSIGHCIYAVLHFVRIVEYLRMHMCFEMLKSGGCLETDTVAAREISHCHCMGPPVALLICLFLERSCERCRRCLAKSFFSQMIAILCRAIDLFNLDALEKRHVLERSALSAVISPR